MKLYKSEKWAVITPLSKDGKNILWQVLEVHNTRDQAERHISNILLKPGDWDVKKQPLQTQRVDVSYKSMPPIPTAVEELLNRHKTLNTRN